MDGPDRAASMRTIKGIARFTVGGSGVGLAEHVGGVSNNCMTNGLLLSRGLELPAMLREDVAHMGAEDLRQLQRTRELRHRLLASESVTQHTLLRKETRRPGYDYRGDHTKLDDENWHCFTLSHYDRNTGKWEMEKAPVCHVID